MPSMPLENAPALYEPQYWMTVLLHTHEYRDPDYDRDNKIYRAHIFYDEERDVYMYELERDPRWSAEWLIKYDKIKHDICTDAGWAQEPIIGDVLCSIAENENDFREASFLQEMLDDDPDDELTYITFNEWKAWMNEKDEEEEEEEEEEDKAV